MYSEMTTFPMMGVGVFNVMFWIGFVVGHNIGLTCDAMLLNALLFGGIGSYGVVKLERMFNGNVRKKELEEEKPVNQSAHSAKPIFES